MQDQKDNGKKRDNKAKIKAKEIVKTKVESNAVSPLLGSIALKDGPSISP